ncbi:hypothetical protein GCM10014715_59780 [Streptomyces spiralis]|uniref:Uncharacterized protein n=1 Tax=Streptomyces spiralis TaxID=66376 RepID=A0A919AB01_9ACTN|nr:hypothetical protein GCM10014715_59780 [Streptomyces spiralis]
MAAPVPRFGYGEPHRRAAITADAEPSGTRHPGEPRVHFPDDQHPQAAVRGAEPRGTEEPLMAAAKSGRAG